MKGGEPSAPTTSHRSSRRPLAMAGSPLLVALVFIVLTVLALLTAFNIQQLGALQQQVAQTVRAGGFHLQAASKAPELTYAVYADQPDSGYLKHVWAVLGRAGYSRSDIKSSTEWSVLWAHDYPFVTPWLNAKIASLRPGQKVNKFPGSGFITSKVSLATAGLKNVPPAFSLPSEKEKLLAYAAQHPEKMFVQKTNTHRGIKIEQLSKLNLDEGGSFVQEFIHNPLLVDGYKFDIGVYVTLTSVDPLRIYVHQSDALLRFCSVQYHPFDSANRDKYVVGDDYLPSWEVPSFTKFMTEKVGFSFKDALNGHIKSLGRDPDVLWSNIYNTISEVYQSQEGNLARAASQYPVARDTFFEMVRFDFVIDDQLKVYLMEANMSPNLSSDHFQANAMLYEQVLHSLLRLVGVVGRSTAQGAVTRQGMEMEVQDKDLLVYVEACGSPKCEACDSSACELCKQCLKETDLAILRQAWLERKNQFATMRIFPPAVSRSAPAPAGLVGSNRLMAAWYQGKCLMDRSWCDA